MGIELGHKRLKFYGVPNAAAYPITYLQRVAMKPEGLWYSCGDGRDSWPDWCLGVEFGLKNLAWSVELTLDLDRILKINSSADFLSFESSYTATPPWPGATRSLSHDYIDWPELTKSYGGIEITPYLWDHRISSMWYYGWDCASGCVWDLSAIKEWGVPQETGIDEQSRSHWQREMDEMDEETTK